MQYIDSMWQDVTVIKCQYVRNNYLFTSKNGRASIREGASIRINTVLGQLGNFNMSLDWFEMCVSLMNVTRTLIFICLMPNFWFLLDDLGLAVFPQHLENATDFLVMEKSWNFSKYGKNDRLSGKWQFTQ